MDQHYDFQDACEWKPNTSEMCFQTLIQGCAGDRLEGWMEERNTKNRFCDQLRNFVKVGEPQFQTLIHADGK